MLMIIYSVQVYNDKYINPSSKIKNGVSVSLISFQIQYLLSSSHTQP